jgi:hypothetical protein
VSSTTCFDDGRGTTVRDHDMRVREQIVQVVVADIVDALSMYGR